MSFIKVAAHNDSVVECGYLVDHPQNTGGRRLSAMCLPSSPHMPLHLAYLTSVAVDDEEFREGMPMPSLTSEGASATRSRGQGGAASGAVGAVGSTCSGTTSIATSKECCSTEEPDSLLVFGDLEERELHSAGGAGASDMLAADYSSACPLPRPQDTSTSLPQCHSHTNAPMHGISAPVPINAAVRSSMYTAPPTSMLADSPGCLGASGPLLGGQFLGGAWFAGEEMMLGFPNGFPGQHITFGPASAPAHTHMFVQPPATRAVAAISAHSAHQVGSPRYSWDHPLQRRHAALYLSPLPQLQWGPSRPSSAESSSDEAFSRTAALTAHMNKLGVRPEGSASAPQRRPQPAPRPASAPQPRPQPAPRPASAPQPRPQPAPRPARATSASMPRLAPPPSPSAAVAMKSAWQQQQQGLHPAHHLPLHMGAGRGGLSQRLRYSTGSFSAFLSSSPGKWGSGAGSSLVEHLGTSPPPPVHPLLQAPLRAPLPSRVPATPGPSIGLTLSQLAGAGQGCAVYRRLGSLPASFNRSPIALASILERPSLDHNTDSSPSSSSYTDREAASDVDNIELSNIPTPSTTTATATTADAVAAPIAAAACAPAPAAAALVCTQGSGARGRMGSAPSIFLAKAFSREPSGSPQEPHSSPSCPARSPSSLRHPTGSLPTSKSAADIRGSGCGSSQGTQGHSSVSLSRNPSDFSAACSSLSSLPSQRSGVSATTAASHHHLGRASAGSGSGGLFSALIKRAAGSSSGGGGTHSQGAAGEEKALGGGRRERGLWPPHVPHSVPHVPHARESAPHSLLNSPLDGDKAFLGGAPGTSVCRRFSLDSEVVAGCSGSDSGGGSGYSELSWDRRRGLGGGGGRGKEQADPSYRSKLKKVLMRSKHWASSFLSRNSNGSSSGSGSRVLAAPSWAASGGSGGALDGMGSGDGMDVRRSRSETHKRPSFRRPLSGG